MKNLFLTILLSFCLYPFMAGAATAPLISIVNTDSTGGGITYDNNPGTPGAAIAGHVQISGIFSDEWTVTLDPAAATFNVSTSNPLFTSFTSDYSYDGSIWSTFDNLVTTDDDQKYSTVISSVSKFFVRVSGQASGTANSYDLRVSAVPIPAAVWLFGSALMGLVGVSRRKSTALAA